MTGGLTGGRWVGVGLADGVAVGVAAGLVSAAAEVAGEADVLALADALACAAVESAALLAVVDPDARRTPTHAGQHQHNHGDDAGQQTTPAAPGRRSPGPAPPRPACGRALPAGVPAGPAPAPPAAGCTS